MSKKNRVEVRLWKDELVVNNIEGNDEVVIQGRDGRPIVTVQPGVGGSVRLIDGQLVINDRTTEPDRSYRITKS